MKYHDIMRNLKKLLGGLIMIVKVTVKVRGNGKEESEEND